MARKPLISTSKFPYHITNRSNNKEFFYLPSEELWWIFLTVFKYLKTELGCEIHGFVLMSNHYHLLMTTPKANLSEAMTYLHREVAKRANREANRINHFFGGRYKWSVIGCENYFWNALKYVFRNPIEAGLCLRVEDYKYSSLNFCRDTDVWNMVDKFHESEVPIELDLDWLNESFPPGHRQGIQKALRRREFTVPTDKNGNKLNLDDMQRKKGLGT